MSVAIKKELLDLLICPNCGGAYRTTSSGDLTCIACSKKVNSLNGKPIFTPIPRGMQATPKLVRGPDEGSPWRRANWRFLETVIKFLPEDAVILDFGAGHGDFSKILCKYTNVALDVFPYDEVDIVCDLEKIVPFKKRSFDAIVLMNVLEHIRQPVSLMKILAALILPSGLLIVAVPFLLKLHQQPYDFYRYSHHQLADMGNEAGLELVKVEGYYDPILLLKESMQNISSSVLPNLPSVRRKTGRLILEGISGLVSNLQRLIGNGYVRDPKSEKSPYPIGYHVIYRAKPGKKK
jgi:SAM-dependent methyltransferase